MIEHDHHELEELVEKLEFTGESAPMEVLDDLSRLLVLHAATELEVVYPAVRSLSAQSKDSVKQGRLDNEEVAMSILRLEKVPLGTVDFRQELGHLVFHVRSHIRQDREEIIPLMLDFTATHLVDMARQAERARAHVPTRRAHPAVLKSGIGSKVAYRVMAITDRVMPQRRKAS